MLFIRYNESEVASFFFMKCGCESTGFYKSIEMKIACTDFDTSIFDSLVVLYHVKRLRNWSESKTTVLNETVEVLLFYGDAKESCKASTCICFAFDKCDIISVSHWKKSYRLVHKLYGYIRSLNCVAIKILAYLQYRVTLLRTSKNGGWSIFLATGFLWYDLEQSLCNQIHWT